VSAADGLNSRLSCLGQIVPTTKDPSSNRVSVTFSA
jgi:hypothetical protein